ncbi:xanthine dehydrogenase family protein molybdopterin-binding subunit [Acidocella sp.]|jgi:carbon-monoxide dehydrogenase large subunit|uniref:xanthine dehydrogenase family protein molybdopterin-binding subunit n=1 Tax=Acidocella sp. TaxID=50710 RepID=UPI002F40CE07
MTEAPFTQIGRALPRREDRRFLTGAGRYVDDIVIPQALHVTFLRSPHAHARIVRIDTEAAAAMPGIAGIFTGRDVAQWASVQQMAPPIEGLQPTSMLPFPVEKVRFQGDLVACVVATDRYLAEDAAEAIEVEYDILGAVADMDTALRPGAPRVDEDLASNQLSEQHFSAGDVAARFKAAHEVVTAHFSQHRQTQLPLETRGCAVVWDEGRQHLTFHTGNQVPHPLRTSLARRLNLAESQITVICPDVGGGFGQKIALYREELTVAALARHLNRPVRWREDRLENLQGASHAREARCETRAAVAADGRILGLELTLTEDFGAYCFFPGNYIARVIALILTGPYRIADYAYEVRIALTNKCGAGPMRAPMAMASWVMDGTLDAVARQLGLDPLEVRRVNMLQASELPYTMPTGELLEDITPSETLEAVVAAIGYEDFRHRQISARAAGRYLGLGLCTVVEPTTYGSRFYKAAGIAGSGHESAWVRIEPTGTVRASVGLQATGQGYESSLPSAVAEGLGVDAANVQLELGNTDVAPYGMGSRGARGATAGGGALYLCARKAQEKVLNIAAHLLTLNSAGDLRLREGRVERLIGGDWTGTGISLTDIARVAYLDPLALPPGMEPGLDVSHAYDPPAMTYSNSSHACEVELDVATGRVTILRYVVAEDCGMVLNPVVVRGQQQGAIAMGLSGSLFEHVVYDASGQNLSSTLADYLVATASELPNFEILPMHTPNRRTAAGIKGMAEGGVMGAIGAVTNAVNDALSPFGVTATHQPLTPPTLRGLLRGRT